MKITCFIESLAGGGAEHQMSILCSILSQKGYEVTLVSYSDRKDHYTLPNKVKRVNLGSGKNGLWRFMAVFFYFIKAKSDCIISYRQACNARVLIPLLFRRKRSISIICGERNVHYGNNLDKYEKLLFGGLYNRADAIVTNSYTQKSYISTNHHHLIGKLSTIINYTDLDVYRPVMRHLRKDKILIGVFSRVGLQKNVRNFIEAISALKNKCRKSFEIHWYGNKESNCPYQVWLDHFKCGDVLFFHDAVAKTQDYIGNFHAICQPSLFEGFSNSISEAICCGRPVLASDVSDNSLMIKNGVNGFLFDPHNIDNIVESFISFINLSEDAIYQMGIESRKIAEGLFDKGVFTNSYIELINKVTKDKYKL